MTKLAVLLAAVLLAALAPVAHAAFFTHTEWPGGFRFGGSMTGLAVDPTGRMVVSREGRDVFRYTSSGREAGRIRRVGAGSAIAVDLTGRVFTATSDGIVTRWGADGRREARFSAGNPVDALAVDRAGNVYAAGDTNVARYSPDGTLGQTYGGPSVIGRAAAVAVDAGGNVFVADPARQRVEEFGPSGDLVRTIGGSDAHAGGLRHPTGVGVDDNGRLFVADPGEPRRSFEFSRPWPRTLAYSAADGRYLGPVDTGLALEGNLQKPPMLLAVAPQGDVYFTGLQAFGAAKIAAALVPVPRFLFETGSPADEYTAVPTAVGDTVNMPTRFFPSLSTGVSASVALPDGVLLAPDSSSTAAADVPAGQTHRELFWPLHVATTGRHVVRFTARGTGPEGQPTELTRSVAVYGFPRPRVRVAGALYLPDARVMLVGTRLDLGGVKIAGRDRGLIDSLLSGNLTVQARAGGRRLRSRGVAIGEERTGQCYLFDVPRRAANARRVAVRALFRGSPFPLDASGSRVVTRRLRTPRHGLFAGCLDASGFAGLPTR